MINRSLKQHAITLFSPKEQVMLSLLRISTKFSNKQARS
jgi:hypothetical protein